MAARPRSGPIRFARYAFMPNRLGYCGGRDERGLFESCVANRPAPELGDWAGTFEGAYPYLALIAGANSLPDPLDDRVVEPFSQNARPGPGQGPGRSLAASQLSRYRYLPLDRRPRREPGRAGQLPYLLGAGPWHRQ